MVSTKDLYHGLSILYLVMDRAWTEAATKGAVLLFAASELEYYFKTSLSLSSGTSGILGGMGGGIAQAYTTMGICTFMKTVEVVVFSVKL